jgi:spore germination protein KC
MPLLLSGCWSYRSLADLSIVMGMSVDKDSPDADFIITAEVADLTKSLKESSPGSKKVEAMGKTIFEAVRDAKRRLDNRPYFGNMQIVSVGERMAREVGILNTVDWIMRDAETRETINMLIFRGGDGRDLFKGESTDQALISLAVDSIIASDNKITASIAHKELYQAYDILNGKGMSLTLPAFHIVENAGTMVVEADGTAAFKGDKLVGYLSPEESKYFLIAMGECEGGILALAMKGPGKPDTSLEIADSSAKKSYAYEGGKLTVRVETETNVYLAETMEDIDVTKEDEIKALEEEAGKRLELEIKAVIDRVQRDLKTDIFGFGHYIHQHNLKLWRQLENNWDTTFETLPVSVSCKVTIKNTAFITSKEVIKH